MGETESNEALQAAIRMLGRREHSEAEVRQKLTRNFRALGTDALDDIAATLIRDGYLSDDRFAESLVRSRVAKGYGPYYIRRELAMKGIRQDLVAQYLDGADIDWQDVATRIVERRHADAFNDADAWVKAARYLQRRGFSGELVVKAVGARP